MLATSGIQRSFGFAAAALLLLFGLIHLLKSFPSPRTNIHVFGHIHGYDAHLNRTGPVRIKKATALVGQPNHLYEAALKTHERHNKVHGYEMQVLRQKVALNTFWAKPSFLLSMVVEELAKPADERVDWIAWFNADTMVLNPQVPLELFLPPADEKDILFVATHDSLGLNSGVLFIRVDQWTIRMLIEVLAVPLKDNRPEVAVAKDQAAFEQVLAIPAYNGRCIFLPRPWFNAFHVNGTFDGVPGSLLVRFPEVNANKWTAMEQYVANVSIRDNAWEVKLRDTAYESMTADFWERVRQARVLLSEAEERLRKHKELLVKEAAEKMKYTLSYHSDKYDVMIEALHDLNKALNDRQWE